MVLPVIPPPALEKTTKKPIVRAKGNKMIWANNVPIPDVVNINIICPKQRAHYCVPVQVTLVPKNPDKTVFDCSPAVSANLYYDNGLDGSGFVGGFGPVSITLANANGITFQLNSGWLNTIVQGGNGGGRLCFTANDGSNDVDIAVGTWTSQETA